MKLGQLEWIQADFGKKVLNSVNSKTLEPVYRGEDVPIVKVTKTVPHYHYNVYSFYF